MSYADRFNQCLARPGKSRSGVADAMGVSVQAVGAICRGITKSATASNNTAAARYFGVDPSWLASGEGLPPWQSPQGMTPPDRGVAHDPSVPEITLPPVITREQLMDPQFELPPVFEIVMPDDAMAPEIPAGRAMIFVRTSTLPKPGARILIADQAGRRHVRRYAEGRDGAWRALPDNRAHMDLDSSQDGLQLLAVLKWVGAE